jgi:NAD(P)-dependent dehydrogenase (short-subunit alcohol dehydrogenase family)
MGEKKQVVLVTGAAGGLGRDVIKHFVQNGADVHGTYHSESKLAGLKEYLGAHADAVTLHQVDLTDESAVTQLMQQVKAHSGRLDVLANIAGGFSMGSIEKAGKDAWEKMVSRNATSAYVCCHAAVPIMKEQGGGRIVNVSALGVLERGEPKMAAYGASKAAVLSLTEHLAQELLADHITVNAVLPTTIDTPENREAMPKADRSTWLPTEKMAQVIGFLGSDAADIVTGAAVTLSTA